MAIILKQVREIDDNGFVVAIHHAEFDEEGNLLEELPDNYIWSSQPHSMHRPRWTDIGWVEDMSQEEIDEKNKFEHVPTIEDFMLEMDFRVSTIELGL
jgi:hypothetical protein